MTAIDSPVGEPHVAVAVARSSQLRLVQSLVCLGVGAAIWFSPLALPLNTKAALAISAMMIIAWMTEVMEYASAGLVGEFDPVHFLVSLEIHYGESVVIG